MHSSKNMFSSMLLVFQALCGAMGRNRCPYKSRSKKLWVSDLLCMSPLEGSIHSRPLGLTSSISESVRLERVPASHTDAL